MKKVLYAIGTPLGGNGKLNFISNANNGGPMFVEDKEKLIKLISDDPVAFDTWNIYEFPVLVHDIVYYSDFREKSSITLRKDEKFTCYYNSITKELLWNFKPDELLCGKPVRITILDNPRIINDKLINDNTNYTSRISEDILEFDFDLFMKVQREIYLKYELNTKDEGIHLTDRYFMQIFEEIHEVKREENDMKVIEEILDIVMYLGSTYCTFDKNLIDHGKKVFVKKGYEYGFTKKDIHALMDRVSSSLMVVRRLYPERKWHRKNSDPIENRDKIAMDTIRELIWELLEYVLFINLNGFNGVIDSMMITKQLKNLK
ncbi:hypothetical protein INTERNEXUS_82 [Bacillus phage vB_BspM_Internexus]|nr:hypothetical protein INTERNEXUS_82 [Bacillus phage vB_BspM_Internexus]